MAVRGDDRRAGGRGQSLLPPGPAPAKKTPSLYSGYGEDGTSRPSHLQCVCERHVAHSLADTLDFRHGNQSPAPSGKSGNTFIYGHNNFINNLSKIMFTIRKNFKMFLQHLKYLITLN